MAVVKILEGARAQYHRSTGLMRLEGTAEAVLSALRLESSDEDSQNLMETFWHEWVHHIQAMTFLSLQGDVPGASFDALLKDKKLLSGQLDGLTARKIAECLGFHSLFEQFSRVKELHPAAQHPLMFPVLDEMVQTLGPDLVFEVCARPHTANNQRALHGGIDESLFPPLLLGAYRFGAGTIVAFGVARKRKEIRMGIILSTALLAAVDSMVFSRDHRIVCPNTDCPNHASSVCSGYYTPPEDPSSCGFRNEVASLCGRELREIVDSVRALSLKVTVDPILNYQTTAEIFPEIEFDKDDERDSCAEHFDELYMLDSEDNDPVTMVFCRTPGCDTILQLRASKRRSRRGFSVVCSNCGHEYQVNDRMGPVFHYQRPKP